MTHKSQDAMTFRSKTGSTDPVRGGSATMEMMIFCARAGSPLFDDFPAFALFDQLVRKYAMSYNAKGARRLQLGAGVRQCIRAVMFCNSLRCLEIQGYHWYLSELYTWRKLRMRGLHCKEWLACFWYCANQTVNRRSLYGC